MIKPVYVNIDRGRVGKCNICLEEKELTWEHIIPEAATFYNELVLFSVNQILNKKAIEFKPRFSQNGIKLRTVCGECNNRIGSLFDTSLIKFFTEFKNQAELKKRHTSKIHIRTEPNSIMRALLGHLLAAKYELDFTDFDKEARNCLFNLEDPIPNSLNFFYWPYPYKNLAIYRDFMMNSQNGNPLDFSIFQIYMVYPISFIVTDLDSYAGLKSLNNFKSNQITDTFEIEVDLMDIKKNPRWPRVVDTSNMLILGQGAVNSIEGTERINIKT